MSNTYDPVPPKPMIATFASSSFRVTATMSDRLDAVSV